MIETHSEEKLPLRTGGIDDNPTNLKLITALLERASWNRDQLY